ncbi:MAG TPA: transcriptional repressor LexA [Thermoanaerobaculia bacterium]|nr:transcriptional repressor LexA [Thermoanaerobaculia bacterium]
MAYLTERQKEILEFVHEYRRERGIAPTHREICDRFGYSSYGTVYKHLKLLQDKGFLRRDWNQKRGIELIRAIPGGPAEGPWTEGPHPASHSGGTAGDPYELPFFGRIAAGKPIEAVSGNERVAVPGHLLSSRGGDHYVLRVVGDSMIEEGIHDGDYVVVLRRDVAEPGEMVVALVGDEATLKRFYPEPAATPAAADGSRLSPGAQPVQTSGMIRLQPANPNMKPIVVPARDVRVQGVVVGLMRKF